MSESSIFLIIRKKKYGCCTQLCGTRTFLLNMNMIADMIFAVAIEAIAAGAVPEFQLRIGYIRPSADGAAVSVIRLGRLLILSSVELDHLGLGCRGAAPAKEPAGIQPPFQGDNIPNILTEEQEVICQRDQWEDIVGEGVAKDADQNDCQIQKSKDPGLDRDNKEQQEVRLREKGRIAEEETHIQIVDICLAAEDHGVNIHEYDAGKIEQVKFQCAPCPLHDSAQRIIAQKADKHHQDAAAEHGQRIGNEPPDLSMEDRCPVEHQKVIEQIVSGNIAHQINNGVADADIKHQIGNALIAVLIAEQFKFSTEIFQFVSAPCGKVPLFYQHLAEKSIADL